MGDITFDAGPGLRIWIMAIGSSGVGLGDGVRVGLRVLMGEAPGEAVPACRAVGVNVNVGEAGNFISGRMGDEMGAGVTGVSKGRLSAWTVRATAVGR
jgi:hypothetical protein